LIFGINSEKLVGVEEENEKVETHGINECGGENCVVRRGYRTTDAWDPISGQ
jgi:hypothetical protein